MVVPVQKPHRSKQDFCTPPEFLSAVRRLLKINGFYLDLAADGSNAIAPLFADSFAQPSWSSGSGWNWLNPPFQDITPWVKRAFEEARDHEAQIAVLVPASVGSNWWRDWVHEKAEVLFLNGRLAFMPDKPKWLYPKDCALLLYSLNRIVFGWTDYQVWNWRKQPW